MSPESPKPYIQTNEAGQLESTDRAVDIAEKAKRELDSLLEEVQSSFPKRESMNTEQILIDKQTDITEKGILAILAESCPDLKDAFAKNPRLARYAYGHMFSEMQPNLDANAIPVIPEKPVSLGMTDGVVTINVPMEDGNGGYYYVGARFDLFPWEGKPEGELEQVDEPGLFDHPQHKARPGLDLDEFEGNELPDAPPAYTPEENAKRVPAFMEGLDTMDRYMKDYERSTARTRRRLDNGNINDEEARAYLGESDNILENINMLEIERDRLVASRGLEYGSLDNVNGRIDAYKEQYGMTEHNLDPDAESAPREPHLARDTRTDAWEFLNVKPEEPVPVDLETPTESLQFMQGLEALEDNVDSFMKKSARIEARIDRAPTQERKVELARKYIATREQLGRDLDGLVRDNTILESGPLNSETTQRDVMGRLDAVDDQLVTTQDLTDKLRGMVQTIEARQAEYATQQAEANAPAPAVNPVRPNFAPPISNEIEGTGNYKQKEAPVVTPAELTMPEPAADPEPAAVVPPIIEMPEPAPDPEPAPEPLDEFKPTDTEIANGDPRGDVIDTPTGYEGETHDDLDEEPEAPKRRLFNFGSREKKKDETDDTELPTGTLD